MLSTWLFSEVLAIENKSVSLQNECLTKNRPRFMSAYFQETERAFGYIFVDNRPDTPSDEQVLSGIFGSCRRYPTIISSAKLVETVKTTSYKENIACEARSAVKSPPVVKPSPPIVKKVTAISF